MIGWPELLVLVSLLGVPGLWALYDIVRREFAGNDKLVWTVIVLALPVFGTLLYLFVGRRRRLR